MQLSKHFKLIEFTKSQSAIRRDISNNPKKEHVQNLEYLCINTLEPIRKQIGIVNVNSGYRSKELNKAIGGSYKSFHSLGCASDIECNNISNLEIIKTIYKLAIPFTELIAEYFDTSDGSAGWVHIAIQKDRGTERILKLKDKNNNYKRITFEELLEIYK